MKRFVAGLVVLCSSLMFGQKIEPDNPDPLGDVQKYAFAAELHESGGPACDVIMWGAERKKLVTDFVYECSSTSSPFKANGILFLRREGEGGLTFSGNGNELTGVNAQIMFRDGMAYISPRLVISPGDPPGTMVPVVVEGQTIRLTVPNQSLLLDAGIELKIASYIYDTQGFDMAPDIGFGKVKTSFTLQVFPPRSRHLQQRLASSRLVVAVVPDGMTLKESGDIAER